MMPIKIKEYKQKFIDFKNEIVSSIKSKLVFYLNGVVSYLTKKKDDNSIDINFDSLAPINTNALENKVYFDALDFAFKNNNVKNIALTGSYGAGKSSILKSYISSLPMRDRSKFINISLANFNYNDNENSSDSLVDGETGNDNRDKKKTGKNNNTVEFSILQQIIYNERKGRLPFSRLDRIDNANSGRVLRTTLYFATLLFFISSVCLILLPTWMTLKLNLPSYIQIYLIENVKTRFSLGLISVIMSLYFLVRGFIKKGLFTSNYNLDKVNVVKGDISLSKSSERSLLNIYFDEILYFFENTKFEFVIFEDLDRLNENNLFSKLRELNQLINSSAQIKREIKFLFAIKDDIFPSPQERTKFFDFIIPVIPFLDSNNSYDLLKKEISKFNKTIPKLESKPIQDQFLIDISIFIDDFRILKNILNEYYVYYNKVFSDVDAQKLLSIIIYKNLMPEDFCLLQNSKGMMFEVIDNYLTRKLHRNFIAGIDGEIKGYRERISYLTKEVHNSVKGLRAEYVYLLLPRFNDKDQRIKIDSKEYSASELIKNEDGAFDKIVNNEGFTFVISNYNVPGYSIHGNGVMYFRSTFEEMDKSINGEDTYKIREQKIKDVTDGAISEIEIEIEKLECSKKYIYKLSMKDLINKLGGAFYSILDVIVGDTASVKEKEFISYLLSRGYIDENYNDYISIFHQITLSMNDKIYLRSLKGRKGYSDIAAMDLNHINEISMRIDKDNDCKYPAILHRELIKYFIVNSNKFKGHLINVLNDAILENIDNGSIDFINKEVQAGINGDPVIIKWFFSDSRAWTAFYKIHFNNDMKNDSNDFDYLKHASRIITCNISKTKIQSYKNVKSLLEYVQDQEDYINTIPSHSIDYVESFIEALPVYFSKLAVPKDAVAQKLLSFIIIKNKYKLNIHNLENALYLSNHHKVDDDFYKCNITCILNSKNESVIKRINTNIDYYLGLIMSQLDDNNYESESTILKLLNNSDVSSENKIKLISSQKTKLNTIELLSNEVLDGVDKGAVDMLFELGKVYATWKVVLEYASLNKYCINSFLVSYLNMEDVYTELRKHELSYLELSESDIYFFENLLNCDELDDVAYNFLSLCSPVVIKKITRDISISKLETLILINKISPTKEVITHCLAKYESGEVSKLLALLMSKFPEDFQALYPENIQDDDNEFISSLVNALLESQNTDIGVKSCVMDDVFSARETHDYEFLSLSSKLITQISRTPSLSIENIKEIIKFTGNDKVRTKIFNIYFKSFKDDLSLVCEILGLFVDESYKNLAMIGKRPNLSLSEENLEMLQNLHSVGIITSFSINQSKRMVQAFCKRS